MEQELNKRIAELERENASLRTFNVSLQAQKKEYLDVILGPVREEDLPTEEQFAEMMKTRYPAEEVFRELGIPFGKTAS